MKVNFLAPMPSLWHRTEEKYQNPHESRCPTIEELSKTMSPLID